MYEIKDRLTYGLLYYKNKRKMNHKATFLIFTFLCQIYSWTFRKIKFNINILLKLKSNVRI